MKQGVTGTEQEASEDISNLLARQRQRERGEFPLLESDIKPRLLKIINKEEYTI